MPELCNAGVENTDHCLKIERLRLGVAQLRYVSRSVVEYKEGLTNNINEDQRRALPCDIKQRSEAKFSVRS